MMAVGILKKYRTLSALEKALFREALWLSVRARFLTLFSSLKHYGKKLGGYRQEGSKNIPPSQVAIAEDVSEAVRRVAKYIPWRCKCLEQAIIAKIMLNRRDVESTLYLGVAKNGKDMKAHAWVSCGDRVITGKRGYRNYTPVSTFA